MSQRLQWISTFASAPHYRNLLRGIKVVALALFAVSLFLPTAGSGGSSKYSPGWFLLAYGWFGFMIGQFAWIGNLGLLIAASTYRRWPMFLTAFSFVEGLNWHDIADDTGLKPVTGYGPGYYLWIAAMLVISVPIILPVPKQDEEMGSRYE